MKIGVALPYNQTRNVAQFAKAAEDSGWDGLFVGDAIWTEDPMIALAAAAVSTSRIRLGTMIVPVPLRKPWKIASESLALDLLSDGRLILGLGTGAVWMGWQGFPDEITDNKARAGMLDETIDILTLLYQRKQFDYDGEHYHLKLTLVDEIYYPPKPVQQPGVPIWVPGIWPRMKSMQRVLKCDGIFTEKLNPDGTPGEITPEDVRQIKTYVSENRVLTTPFDIVVGGNLRDLATDQQVEELSKWQEAGATWFVEGLWEEPGDAVLGRLQEGLAGIGGTPQ